MHLDWPRRSALNKGIPGREQATDRPALAIAPPASLLTLAQNLTPMRTLAPLAMALGALERIDADS